MRWSCLTAGLAILLPVAARADVTIELIPRVGGMVVDPTNVMAGDEVAVDVLLRASGTDDFLDNVRGVTLDFTFTSLSVEIVDFTWLLDATAYSFRSDNLQAPYAITLESLPTPLLVDLDATGVVVARIDVIVAGDGTLTVVGDPEGASGAEVNIGFDPPLTFLVGLDNLAGGVLEFDVPQDPGNGGGNGDVDTDGDGVPDSEDAFPNDPLESSDNDADGIGDVADLDDDNDGIPDLIDPDPLVPDGGNGDPGNGNGDGGNGDGGNGDGGNGDGGDNGGSPPGGGGSLCGTAMIGTLLWTMLGLRVLGFAHRRRR